jgi:uncharacterized membrane protein (UPF0127 family)
MFSRLRPFPFFLVATLGLLNACGRTDAGKEAPLKTVEDRFPVKVGDRVVQMQIVAEPAEMEKGLMFRKSLGDDEGMLFVYLAPQQMGFWMQNTEIPLQIGFFDAAGVLRETYEMYPHDERTVSSHGRDLQFALEMNQGWFSQAGVRPGAPVDLKAVTAALKARGLDRVAARVR